MILFYILYLLEQFFIADVSLFMYTSENLVRISVINKCVLSSHHPFILRPRQCCGNQVSHWQ